MFDFTEESFIEIEKRADELYQSLGEVYCPYFNEKIAFNSKGFKHLKFKSDRQARPQKDQYSRLKLLHLAPKILNKSHTVQGVWRTRSFEDQKTNNKWKHIFKDVIYYEFIAVLDNVRAKVIIKEVIGGEKHFWSIIPFWGIDKQNSKRILHDGNPEND